MAGPGSGKTLVLTHHIKHLIEKGVNPSQILVITFTRQAAGEMQGRFKNLLPSAANKVVFGTFHSVFYRMLKIFNLDTPKITDTNKRIEFLEKVINPSDSLDDISDLISKYKSCVDKTSLLFASDKDKEDFYRCLNEYNCLLAQNHCMDYDDIIELFFKLVNENSKAYKMIKEQFQIVCIDEFQDINEIQYECIKKLFGNVFAVGDEDQSIYGFRGSNPQIMHTFIRDYNPSIYELKFNFRSFNTIIEGANRIIEKNSGRIRNINQICEKKDDKNHFHILNFENKETEAEAVRHDVYKLLEKNRQVAVLLRTNKDVNRYKDMLLNQSLEFKEAEIRNEIISGVVLYLEYVMKKDLPSLKKIVNIPNRDIPSGIFIYDDKSIDIFIKRFNGTSKGQKLYIMYKQLSVMSKLNSFSCVMYIKNVFGLEDYYRQKFGTGFYESVQKTFSDILDIAKAEKNLKALIEKISSLKSQLNKKDTFEKEKNLLITTYHQSKGLEYDCVILPDVVEGKIPDGISIMECNIEEERRLFYVAVTRAQNDLYIYTIYNEEKNNYIPSRFIRDFLP